MIDIINDLSTLSTIPQKTLDKLVRKAVYCINDAVIEDKLADEDITSVDIGIGILYIKHQGTAANNIKYKFEPSVYLSKSLEESLTNGTNPLEDLLLTSLKDKFTSAYKDLC